MRTRRGSISSGQDSASKVRYPALAAAMASGAGGEPRLDGVTNRLEMNAAVGEYGFSQEFDMALDYPRRRLAVPRG